eukprot:CAMPEP_0172153192 /NCGR_PEP_ID=MMETSP1050-20130122/1289_1 /TAXON_ID=233186 /ORGANISM="Cryptomonas curvata, Strain CCAP979/52" /LENGTH=39 /DNA_ID= /DNA_START= /DNA_END= /DNA_ORIENTATION=
MTLRLWPNKIPFTGKRNPFLAGPKYLTPSTSATSFDKIV